jgi:hypothetical protein
VVTKVYYATWSQAYASTGAQTNYYGASTYQGNDGDGNGDMRSLIGFDVAQIAADVGPGGTITGATVHALLEYAAGPPYPTAQWGMHSYASKPTTWNADNVWARAWPRATNPTASLAAWDLDASDIDDTIKNGTFKGLALGPANSNNGTLAMGLSGWDNTDGYLTITYTPASSGAASLSAGSSLAAAGASGPVATANLLATSAANGDAYSQPPTVALAFDAASTATVGAQADGAGALTFAAVSTAAPIGALYLRQWGLQIGDM